MASQRHVHLELVVAVQRLDGIDRLGLDFRRMAARPQQRQHERGEFVAQRQAGEAQAHVRAGALQRERRLAGVVAVGAQRDLVGAQALDRLQQVERLLRRVAVVERRDDLERLLDALQIAGELVFQFLFEHDRILSFSRVQADAVHMRAHPSNLNSESGPADRLVRSPVLLWRAHSGWARGEGGGHRPPLAAGAWYYGATGPSDLRSCRPGPATASALRRLRSTWPGRLRPGAMRRTGLPSPCAAVRRRRGRCRCRALP